MFIRKILSLGTLLLFLVGIQAEAAKMPPVKKGTQVHFVTGLSKKKQETEVWCWAAATQMILSKHMAKKPEQCEIVSKAFNANCCMPAFKRPLVCRQGNWPEKVMRTYGLDAHMVNHPSFQRVYQEIVRGEPVLLVINPGGSAHAIVAFGAFESEDGSSYIIAWDPYNDIRMFFKTAEWGEAVFSSKD